MTAHRVCDVAMEVTWNPSFHFLLIHLNGKESLTLYDCCVYNVPFDMTTRQDPLDDPATPVT
eukprot:CAMPEP_0175068974 /NCGR_PEP_ID=MMETSP0052_2-20121109/17955_1 /TAXON_ID=51329 ORGANISM="Polytomella parva, Strain SAG 63-3" /NCGR_SAMPLE_ID=MMETSP0052_2 /ASSEMBLY_ACC=CAM_ASM_000194 /LENGTH=61 /DNA_ID=CAMNT_0016336033 /DNA_START=784 /DNA_END=969 /DNA_ORIENTATION=+